MQYGFIFFNHDYLSRITNIWSKPTGKAQLIFLFSFFMLIFCYCASADSADVSGQGHFRQASPVVLTNLLYSVFSENPAISPVENERWGHVTATRIYDPAQPDHTEKIKLWDAGTELNNMVPGDRTIYFPHISVTRMTNVTIGMGDGNTRAFSGTLSHPILAGTVKITDQEETFNDVHMKDLTGDLGGTGVINRFSGAFRITFNEAPADGIPVICRYAYYTLNHDLVTFDNSHLNNGDLGLDDFYTVPDGCTHDLDGSGGVDEQDGDFLVQWVQGYSDGSRVKKKWLLGAVEHCVPAVATPPGTPAWYYGTAINKNERESFDSFLARHKKRRCVLYVGAKDGMVHAFDAGRFCWSDNPETAVVEKRGYFEWVALSSDFSLKQRWSALLALYPAHPPDFRWRSTGTGTKAPDYGSGKELWAFVPPDLLARLKNNFLGSADQASVDASPTIADVCIHGAWRTVLVSGEGNGGDAVFCLDVTDPEKPLFLWEFANPDLIRRHSPPAIARIGETVLGGIKRWVVFVVSGDSIDTTLDPSIFMLDIADGSMIERVFFHAGIDSNGDGIDDGEGGIPGNQAAPIDSDGNGYVDRLYIGTDKGFMFKACIPDDPDRPGYTISSCVLNKDFVYDDGSGTHSVPEDQQRQPIYASPTVVVDNQQDENGGFIYNIRLFFGTGDKPRPDESATGSDTSCHFFAYSDRARKDECGGDTVTLDWFKVLTPGQGVFASAFAAAGSIYFGTDPSDTENISTGTGIGRLYTLDMTDGKVIFEKICDAILSTPLVEDEHLFINTGTYGGKSPVILGGDSYNHDVVKTPTAPPGVQAWKEIW